MDNVIDNGIKSYGEGSVITYDLNFSEGLRGSGDMVITYDNFGTSPILASDMNALALGVTKIEVSYTVDDDVSTTDLAMASFSALVDASWADSAGNVMPDPLGSFTEEELSETADVIVDVDPPVISRVYAEPEDVKLGVWDATHNPLLFTTIKIEFNKIMADLGSNMVVVLNTSDTEYTITDLDHVGTYPSGYSMASFVYQVGSTFTDKTGATPLDVVTIALVSGDKSDLTDGVFSNPNPIESFTPVTDLEESNVQVHVSPPIIKSIETANSRVNGTYGKTASIPVVLNFVDQVTGDSEEVFFGNSATLTVTLNTVNSQTANTGEAVITITDLAANGFSATGQYTVGGNDVNTDALRVTGIGKSSATAVYDEFFNNLDLDKDNDASTQNDADAAEIPTINFTNASYNAMAIDVDDPVLSFIDVYKGTPKVSFTQGTLKIGDDIDLVLSFNEDVKVDGELTITMNTNGTAVIAAS